MPALQVHLTIPLGNAGSVGFTTDTDVEKLPPEFAAALGEAIRNFAELAANTVAPIAIVEGLQAPAIHDPSAAVLDGVRGTRRHT